MVFHDGCPILFRFPSGMSNVISLSVQWYPSNIQIALVIYCLIGPENTLGFVSPTDRSTLPPKMSKNIQPSWATCMYISWDLSTGWMSAQGCPHFRIATPPAGRGAINIPLLQLGCLFISFTGLIRSRWFDHPTDWIAIAPS